MNFFDFPLEVRVMVYADILQEEHHFFRDGVPGLLKTRLQITQEAYSHCKGTATVKSDVAPLYMNNLEDIKKSRQIQISTRQQRHHHTLALQTGAPERLHNIFEARDIGQSYVHRYHYRIHSW